MKRFYLGVLNEKFRTCFPYPKKKIIRHKCRRKGVFGDAADDVGATCSFAAEPTLFFRRAVPKNIFLDFSYCKRLF